MSNQKPTTPQFVFAADCHLRLNIWNSLPDLLYDSLFSFRQIIKYCFDTQQVLVLGGDIFDNPRPNTKLIQFLIEQTRFLKGLQRYWIDGNHDFANPSWSEICGYTNLNKKLQLIRDTTIYGLSNCTSTTLTENLRQIPPHAEVVVCHQLIDTFCGQLFSNMKQSDIPAHVKLTLLGDYHQKSTGGSLDQLIAYPGSSCMCRWGEANDKFILQVNKDVSGRLSLQDVKLRTRQFMDIEIDSSDDLVKLQQLLEPLEDVAYYKEYQKNPELILTAPVQDVRLEPVIRLHFNVGSDVDIRKFEKLVRTKTRFCLTVPKNKKTEFKAATDVVKKSLPELLTAYLQPNTIEFALLTDLLVPNNARPVPQIIKEWKDRILHNETRVS